MSSEVRYSHHPFSARTGAASMVITCAEKIFMAEEAGLRAVSYAFPNQFTACSFFSLCAKNKNMREGRGSRQVHFSGVQREMNVLGLDNAEDDVLRERASLDSISFSTNRANPSLVNFGNSLDVHVDRHSLNPMSIACRYFCSRPANSVHGGAKGTQHQFVDSVHII